MADLLFFVSSMHGGGAERVASLLANEWVSRGHRVRLVATFSGRGRCEHTLTPEVELLFLADLVNNRSGSPLNRLRRLLAIRRLVKQHRPDAVVSFLSTVNVAVLLACLGLGVRTIVSERSYPPLLPIGQSMTWLRKRLYPHSDCVVMQTNAGLEWLTRTVPRARGIVIPNPVSIPLPETAAEPISAQGIPTDNHLIIGVGRLQPEKGFDTLIDAFSLVAVSYPAWRLVILGEGTSRRELQAQIEALHMDERISLPGFAGNLADWYERADMFVMSSRYEGFPNALIEAMSYGKAAISTRCPNGPEEIIDHRSNGILVRPGSPEALAGAMQELMQDASLRQRLGDAAGDIKNRFNLKKIADQWAKVLWIDTTERAR